MASGTGTVKSSLSLALPKPKLVSRRKLRKYSWLFDIFTVEGSIIGRIVGPVLTVTIFATGVAYLWSKGHDVHLTNSVIPVVAVVVGLILVFRNGTSYDRYYEGRKDWGTLSSHVRNLTRLIWINVSLPPPGAAKSTPQFPLLSDITPEQLRRRKRRVIKLVLAFVFATKHYLRDEDGSHWPDLRAVLPAGFARFDESGYSTQRNDSADHLGQRSRHDSSAAQSQNGGKGYAAMESSHDSLTPTPTLLGASSHTAASSRNATKRVRPKRSKKNLAAVTSTTPLLGSSQHTSHTTVEFHPHADAASLPLPLLLAHEINRALFLFKRDGLLETVGPAGTNAMNVLVQGMVDMLTNMERVANTPIPKSYRIHLKQAVGLYLFALPFTMIQDLGWGMIPIVTVVAFTFMGIEGIADEIEMPFGSDESDLPLDTYCADLKEEIEYLLERLPEGGEGMAGFDDGEGDD
ncbi:hypothetical protein PUNSTDRAFT_135584 [Punctularia strigosozonata HHB-11173 SS5]|uniref:uncharacterized protein n=1 Tax=Punctularia strigosozonata (strain HHB-11173) TaxID=741275 RepID=UPI0004417CFE|nr:uncharacterized protein PUNSTDRAFT_135584 [Punctularia strigosozonata HHB-11173 SS5]EIN08069.1 hypothetical protein PUNSTDRAFT_135584 [Punctularia strigosozonata HHB-11173 SS5]